MVISRRGVLTMGTLGAAGLFIPSKPTFGRPSGRNRLAQSQIHAYQLTIQFDSYGLKTINEADQLVTIVKSVSGGVPVAWVSFQPMESNVVVWTETYSVYASTTEIQDGAQIITQLTQPAAAGNTYTLSGGQFDNGEPNLPPLEYGVVNNDPNFEVEEVQMITTGLYQEAIVNGEPTASPLNAVNIPYRESGTFIPIETVQVFTSSYQNGMVSAVSSQALQVDLTQQPIQTIHYSAATNEFLPGPLPLSAARTAR
jgi:hypothetical protein